MSLITIKLTLDQARILWGVVDGALDAGACEGGLEEHEAEALRHVDSQLLRHFDKWRAAHAAKDGRS